MKASSAIAYAPVLRISVSPLNCPEFAQAPSVSSAGLIPDVLSATKSKWPNRTLARTAKATFLAPRPNANVASHRVRRHSLVISGETKGEKTAIIRG